MAQNTNGKSLDNDNDTIYGNSGDDTIDAGRGDDLVYGGYGNDIIAGGEGNDIIYGDNGIATSKQTVSKEVSITSESGQYNLLVWELSDLNISGLTDSPFPNGVIGKSTQQIAGGVMTLAANSTPITVGVNDNDAYFNDGDLSQTLANNETINGVSETANNRFTPEYAYTIREVSTGEVITIYVVELGANKMVGIVSDKPLTVGGDYEFVARVATHPSISYSDLAKTYIVEDSSVAAVDGTNGGTDQAGGNDIITGGEGNDIIYGDNGIATSKQTDSKEVSITSESGQYNLLVWELSDLNISGLTENPFPDGSVIGKSTQQIAGGVMTLAANSTPITVGVNDTDAYFNDGDATTQKLANNETINGVSETANNRFTPEYAYTIREVSTGEVITIYVVELGANKMVGIVSDKPLTVGGDYEFVARVATHPSISYSDLAKTYIVEDSSVAAVDGTNGGTDQAGGNDIITGGEGADIMYGQGGNDTFIVSNATEGKGDVIVGGNGPDQTKDNDTLDLRGAGLVTINDQTDETDTGARKGTVTFSDGSTLEFSQIETILQDDIVVNQNPEAVDDTIDVDYIGPVEIDIATLLDNDIDQDGDSLTGVSVQDAQNGTVEVVGDKLIFTPEQGFEGIASFTYTVSDGNGGIDTATVNLNINISAPDAPANAPDMTAATDTGISDSDDLTNNATPNFVIADPGDNIPSLYSDGEKVLSIYDPVNKTLTPIDPLPEGPVNIAYTLTSDGKESGLSPALSIVIDTIASEAPTNAPDMTAETDTGIKDDDNDTGDRTPSFKIDDIGDGNTPVLYVDGKEVVSVYDPDTKTLTPVEPLSDGSHDVTYTLKDDAGNESAPSPSLSFIIRDQIKAPDAPTDAPDMTEKTDTGLKDDDDDTGDRTPSFKIGEIDRYTPALYVDGEFVISLYDPVEKTLTPAEPIADGTHEITYTLTDSVGNESAPSPSLTIIIRDQNQNPEAVDDTIDVDYIGPIEIDIATLLDNDIDQDGDSLTGVSVQDAQNGTVEVVGDKLIFTPEQGFEGIASFTYTVSDGNGGIDTATVNLNINISAPDAPANAPDMTAATDTGISDSDDLTKLEMPDFAIANPGDQIVTLYVDGTPYPAEYNSTKGVITPTAALEDGQYQITYTLKDPVTGKESAMSPVLLIEVDNDIYQPLTPVDMTDETDTGLSNTDNITSNATPDFAVEVPDNSTPSLIVDGVKVEAIYDADKGTLTPKLPLANGQHEVSYSLMDAAGNESAASPALTVVIGEVNQAQNLIMNGSFEDVTGLTQTFYGFSGEGEVPYWTDSNGLIIDIHNDQRDGVKPTDGTNWADLGGLNSDNRIGQNVSGVVAGQSYKLEFDAGDIRTAEDGKAGDNLVTVYWGGEVIATINPTDGTMSHYEFNLIGGNGNGSNRLEFAGSGMLDNFGVSIDKISLVSQNGSQLSAVDMTAETDSGMNDADNLTNIGVPGFVIDATDGRIPVLYVDGKEVESVFDANTNTVSPVYPLSEGQHLISYKLIDSEGNETPLSEPLGITIDTQAPQIGNAVDMVDASDNGESNQDDITTETKPSFAIEPAGENIPSLYIDGVKVPATYDSKNATLTPIEPLSEGTHAISYSLTDPAGNESAPSLPLPIEIKVSFDVPQENKAPDAKDDVIIGEQDHIITISPSELLGNDSDSDGDDLQGVSLQDPVNGTVYFDGQNVIFTPTAGYSGPASFTYTITDGKGGFDTATVNLAVDAIAAPVAPTSPLDMTPETDTGVSNTDNITGDTTPSFTIQNAGFNTPNLYVDGVKVASTFAFGVLTPIDPISAGHHEVSYTLTNPAGKESAPSPVLSIEIEMLAENSNPNAGDDYISAQSGLVVISPSELLANDTDANGDTLQGVSLQDAVNGTVSFDGQNVIFTPAQGYTGPASFTYTITDGKGGFDTATVNLTIASPIKDGIIDFNAYEPNVSSAPPAGWFTDNPGGLIEVLPSDVYGIPGEVTNVLELERYPGDASNFYTFVESKAGETITLDFDYSARSSATWSEYTNSTIVSGQNTTSAVHIMVNGAIFQTIDTNVVGFTHFSLAIPGTGDIMRIEFQAADKNEVGGLIDNIDLSAVPIYLNGLPEGMEPIPVSPDVHVVDDQTNDQPSNGGVKITVEGSDGDTQLQGTAGNDVINGGGTKDIIQAGAGDDVIYGNAGDDVISGGAGNDKMDGGVGADTFTWTLADTNGAGVEVDTVYNIQQNDVIDLKDLLNGESHDAESLVNYLHFSVDGDKTTMYVSADGKFSEGNVDLANTTQQIEFVGVDLTAGGSMNDMQVIQNLLSNHQLITD